jgi:aspartyl-tRNA(Asn)/glutamyl-tRNA(Gln) amidotransferase subunit A
LVGMRPTYGRVSRFGLVAYSSSMDAIGPITTTVADTQALMSIIAGHDPRDSTSRPESDFATAGPQEIRVGMPREYLSDSCQPEIRANLIAAMDRAQIGGWKVDHIDLPLTEYALSIYYIIASVEAASNLARFDGVKYGFRAENATSWGDMTTRTRTQGFGLEAKRRILLGTFAASAGYSDQYFNRATAARDRLRAEFAAAFRSVDVLVTPISPTTAWPIGEKTKDPMMMYLSDIYSVPATLVGLPAIVMPTGVDDAGLPTALQICGPVGADALVMQAARELSGLDAL